MDLRVEYDVYCTVWQYLMVVKYLRFCTKNCYSSAKIENLRCQIWGYLDIVMQFIILKSLVFYSHKNNQAELYSIIKRKTYVYTV